MKVAVMSSQVNFISKYNKFFLQAVFFLTEKMVSSEMALQIPVLTVIAVSTTATAILLVTNMTSEMILAEMDEESV